MMDCIVIENHRTQSRVIGSFLLYHRTSLSFSQQIICKECSPGMFFGFQSVLGGSPIMRGLDARLPLLQVGGCGSAQHLLLPSLLLLLLHLSPTTAQFCTGTETFEKVQCMRFMALLNLWQ